MAFYENVFIARQDISAAQVDALADQLTELVKEHGGEVKKREYWGLKNLAYRIKKNRKGHYVLFNLDAPPAAVVELERQMHLNEDVIRYLTTRVKELEEEPSIMMRSRGGRDDRGGRDGRRFGGGRGGPRGDRDGPRGDRDRGDRDRGGRGDGERSQSAKPKAEGDGAEAKAEAQSESKSETKAETGDA